jgi:hypothetical protein
VHELAHELGLDSGRVLAWFREIGVQVGSASAVVPLDAELRLRTAHAAGTLRAPSEASPALGDGSIRPRSARSWSRVLAESRRRSTAWADYWIDDEERRDWIAAGLGPEDGRIAGRLRDRGFRPAAARGRRARQRAATRR